MMLLLQEIIKGNSPFGSLVKFTLCKGQVSPAGTGKKTLARILVAQAPRSLRTPSSQCWEELCLLAKLLSQTRWEWQLGQAQRPRRALADCEDLCIFGAETPPLEFERESCFCEL